MTQDDLRANFLTALLKSGVRLTPFEAGFADSCQSAFNFSRKQRQAVDRMMGKYAAQIGFNGEDKSVAAQAEAEEKRLKMEARDNQRVIVGGRVAIRPVRKSAVAVYKPKS